MKIGGMNQEMQAIMLEATNSTKPATGQQVSSDFGALLDNAINNVNALQKQSGELATRFDQGDPNVS